MKNSSNVQLKQQSDSSKPFVLLFSEKSSTTIKVSSEKIFSSQTEGLAYAIPERTYSSQNGNHETTDSDA